MNVAGVLDNLDHVASAVCLSELENAPAMLNGAARAFRQTFPADSLAWEDAGRLQSIAYMIEQEQTAAAGRPPVIHAAAAGGKNGGLQIKGNLLTIHSNPR